MLYLTPPFHDCELLWQQFNAKLIHSLDSSALNLDHRDALLFHQRSFIDSNPASTFLNHLRPLSSLVRGGISIVLLQQDFTLWAPEAAQEAKLLLHAYLSSTYCIVQEWHKEGVKSILADQLQQIESREPPHLLLMDLGSIHDWKRLFRETGVSTGKK
jgi:hypothetical protein